jgi:hypothetical protein
MHEVLVPKDSDDPPPSAIERDGKPFAGKRRKCREWQLRVRSVSRGWGFMTKLREATGFALVIAGLFGMLMPLIPGVPLLLAGVAVLGTNHPGIQPWIARIRRWRCSLRRQKTGDTQYLIGASPIADEYLLGTLPDIQSPSPLFTDGKLKYWSK